jgi:hypothetical protein
LECQASAAEEEEEILLNPNPSKVYKYLQAPKWLLTTYEYSFRSMHEIRIISCTIFLSSFLHKNYYNYSLDVDFVFK